MLKQLLIFVLVVAAIVAGYIIYQNRSADEAAEENSTGISFICEGGENFVAEFGSDMNTVDILIAGKHVRQLNNIGESDTPFRFSDNEVTYTFVGEEVVVTNVGSSGSYICRQPFDPNNAPYNFGDAGEGAGSTENDIAIAASENIIGNWQSTDDDRSAREFRADGTIVDRYDGEEVGTDVWLAFTSTANIQTPFDQESNTVYLRLGNEEYLFFKISKLTPEELELIYMDRGGVLRYSFIPPISQ